MQLCPPACCQAIALPASGHPLLGDGSLRQGHALCSGAPISHAAHQPLQQPPRRLRCKGLNQALSVTPLSHPAALAPAQAAHLQVPAAPAWQALQN
eukprot:CAMPEP_0171067634 /NCGR_PEP_ID=MMETSP0766_2-20121228/8107_1 /TAXON_ID=439317 /ORGANISM="Gambierdiscus australes, Strain CAWD 149" /LENGTH=95 /DNA_ID=CAMNT_0011523887 /DNA_START=242 /DNA_END=529 /DNA_ORIENTATION=-